MLPVKVNTCSVSHKFIEVYLNGVPTNFVIDSGSQATLIPLKTFEKLNCKLQPTKLSLVDYNDSSIKCLGQAFVKVSRGEDKFTSRILVTDNKQSLLGSDMIPLFKHVNWNVLLVGQVEKAEDFDYLSEFRSVFDDVPTDKVKGRSARLVLKPDAIPKFCPARPVPLAIQPLVEAKIDKLVANGHWSPVTESEWATPLVPVVKPGGGVRLCGDYKVTTNPQLQVAQHPLPTNEYLFAKLANKSVFSKVDLSEAFTQLELDEGNKEMCTVNTSKGLFRVHRLPFGIASSPALWQKTVDSLFSGVEGVLCFVDDILIAGHDLSSHNDRLRKVLTTLKDNNMHVKANKCEIGVDSVSYLGFKVDASGIHKTDDKINAIANVKEPVSITELRSFLGLVNFYSKFVPDLSTIAKPLYALLKKDAPFSWGQLQRDSFFKLKGELISPRFLTHYRPELPLKLSCDASSVGLGIVLSHVMPDKSELPIAYGARSLQKSECNYSQIDKEALSVIYGVKHFHYYLYGRKFTLVTDHKPLLAIFGPKSKLPTMVAARLQRYAVTLCAYNYDIEYRSSGEHGNADALSRLPTDSNALQEFASQTTLMVNFVATPVSSLDVSTATKTDRILSVVHNAVLKGIQLPSSNEFIPYRNTFDSLNVEDGVVLKDYRVVIPDSLRTKMLSVLHEEHMGISKTKALARSYIWWPKLDSDIESMINSCVSCQSFRNCPPKISTHSWEYPKGPWQRIHIDFAGPVNGVSFMVIVDAYSKWPEVIVMKSTTSANVIRALRSLFARYGFPYRLVSDNGPQFVSEEFTSFLTSCGISHSKTAPYHPATNSEAERFVQTLKNFLKTFNPNNLNLEMSVQGFLLKYRTTPHSTTNVSPSELLNKRQIRNVLDLVKPSVCDRVSSKVKKPNTVVRSFNIGDKVMVRRHSGVVKWICGVVIEILGDLHYMINVDGRISKYHIDQVRKGLHETVVSNQSDVRDPYRLSSLVSLEGEDRGDGGGTGVQTLSSVRTRNVRRRSSIPVRVNRGKPPDRLNL